MNCPGVNRNQAQTEEEVKPLMDLCKSGRLFDVQKWIADGKPVNPPPNTGNRSRWKSPLQIAIELGFHSLVQVLLEGGAAVHDVRYSPLTHALWKRRLDLVQLLEKYGADIHSVDMETVFQTWDKDIMEFFIEHGADVETGYPLAHAFCSKIRTALAIFKRYKDRFPSFQEQVNMALRHHCADGNQKWVSLMLWAGADPHAKGPDSPWDNCPPEEFSSALELAAIHGHFEVFKLKAIRLDPNDPAAQDLLSNACFSDNAALLRACEIINYQILAAF